MMPMGTPTITESPNPVKTRRKVAAMERPSARSVTKLCRLARTSAGLGKMAGDTVRYSGVSPRVTRYHTSNSSAMHKAPSPLPNHAGGSTRRAHQDERG